MGAFKNLSMLRSWEALNTWLRSAKEEQCRQLLHVEKSSKRRSAFLLRIFGKYNRLRTERERRELMQ